MKKVILFYILFAFVKPVFGQAPPKPYGALPNQAQLNWHEMGMYCIIHYGVDTYTNKEWGYGDEKPTIINPSNFNAMQIVATAKAGGFKGVVVVAKHHDGFCIWPTKTTPHNITKSPWKNGKGDMIKEYQLACNKLGMQLGLYCSPWDRNNVTYGTPEYVETYRKQLKELYTNYGPIFISWHDGANGGDGYYGGKYGERKIDRIRYYGWDTTWGLIRKWQPNAAIFGDVGPDVRWVGNEEGEAGETCWATYAPNAPDDGKQPSNGYSRYWEATESTRNKGTWMPAECDVPLRPGWFYHEAQNEMVKSPYELLALYYKSVGRGANLDLGISPNQQGMLDGHDVNALKKFGEILKQTFATNLVSGAKFVASNVRGKNKIKYGPQLLTDNNRYSYWATDDDVLKPELVINLIAKKTFNIIRLRENIKLGQRINAFAIDAFIDGKWVEIASATSIGANRLIRLSQNISTNKVRLRITSAEASTALSDFGLFKEPPHLTAPIISRDKSGLLDITTTAPVANIRYTLDGTAPDAKSTLYQKPFLLQEGGIVKARSFEADNKASEVSTRQFNLSKCEWKIMGTTPQIGSKAEYAIDEDVNTTWNTLHRDSARLDTFPQEISVDMGKVESIKAFSYLPRQDKGIDGIADRYTFYISNDGFNWEKLLNGEFSNIRSNPIEQIIPLDVAVNARYFKFSISHVVSGKGVSVAEIGVRTN